jgi:hypothetical protein
MPQQKCIPRRNRLPVLRPGGGLCYLATPHEIHELVRAGLARSYGKGQRLDGAVLFTGPSRAHAGTRYVHSSEISETWIDEHGIEHRRPRLEPNVRGVFAFKSISHLDRARFYQVQLDCLRTA